MGPDHASDRRSVPIRSYHSYLNKTRLDLDQAATLLRKCDAESWHAENETTQNFRPSAQLAFFFVRFLFFGGRCQRGSTGTPSTISATTATVATTPYHHPRHRHRHQHQPQPRSANFRTTSRTLPSRTGRGRQSPPPVLSTPNLSPSPCQHYCRSIFIVSVTYTVSPCASNQCEKKPFRTGT